MAVGCTRSGPLSIMQDGAGLGIRRSCAWQRRGHLPGLHSKHVPVPRVPHRLPALPLLPALQTKQSPQRALSVAKA